MLNLQQKSQWWQTGLFMVLAAAILALVVVWQVVGIKNSIKAGRYIGKPTDIRDTITITGDGKVTGIPDIASVNVGMTTEKRQVADAQKENSQKFNKLLEDLKKLGIKKEDIQTADYRINPVYDYSPERGSVIKGYEVAQSVRIKIRDLDKVGEVLAVAGQGGANQVSGISFTIDDPEKLRQEAREEALLNAKQKAEALARISGVTLGKIVSFSEYGGEPTPYPVYALSKEVIGGPEVAPPSIERGSLDITITATVSYEIL